MLYNMSDMRKATWLGKQELQADVCRSEQGRTLWKGAKNPQRILAVDRPGELTDDRVRATIQDFVTVERTFLQKLFRQQIESSIQGPNNSLVTSKGRSQEGMLVSRPPFLHPDRVKTRSDVLQLGPAFYFLKREDIGELLPPAYKISPTVSAEGRTLLEAHIAPVVQEISADMQELYGVLAHDGNAILLNTDRLMEGNGLTAHAVRKLNVPNSCIVGGKLLLEELNSTQYTEVTFHQSAAWSRANAIQFSAHELGHALVGVGAPQSQPLQEAIALTNQLLIEPKYAAVISENGDAAFHDILRQKAPEILAGEPGWGMPEYCFTQNDNATRRVLYAAYVSAFLQSIGGLSKAPEFLHAVIDDWNRTPPLKSNAERVFPVPGLEGWVATMDKKFPGFKARYEQSGLLKKEDWLPEGERITWLELRPGVHQVTAMSIRKNPRCFLPVERGSYMLDMNYACIDALAGTLKIHFPGGSIAESSFVGEANIPEAQIVEEAKDAGITLQKGTPIRVEIAAGGLRAEKTLVVGE